MPRDGACVNHLGGLVDGGEYVFALDVRAATDVDALCKVKDLTGELAQAKGGYGDLDADAVAGCDGRYEMDVHCLLRWGHEAIELLLRQFLESDDVCRVSQSLRGSKVHSLASGGLVRLRDGSRRCHWNAGCRSS